MSWITLGDWTETDHHAAGVILTDQLGRVGLQLRDDRPDINGAGKWALFGGLREAGEGLVETAIRELVEETGIRFSAPDLRPFARMTNEHGLCIHAFTTPRQFAPSDVRLGEGAGFAFLTEAQINAGPTVPSTQAIIARWFALIK